MKKPFNTEQRDATKATERKFSMEQVAELIGGVHPSTVCRLMNKRKIGYYQIGTRRMVGESHLQEFLRLAEREAKVRSIH
jgi:excisionase family DNA binding protein